MKKTTRAALVAFARNDWLTMHTDRVAATADDALASDAAQRATIRDLKARLAAVRAAWDHNYEKDGDYVLAAATDPKNKNWRKP